MNWGTSLTIVISGHGLTIEKVVSVARHAERVELSEEACTLIRKCRVLLEDKIAAGEVIYGVNTGIGEFSETKLDDEQVKQFQRYLIFNHAAGIGDPAPLEYVRGAMLGRINVHAKGNSACRLEITQCLVEMLNKDVTPFVCQKGSVGASGDLAPMSQIALALMNEGHCYYEGVKMETCEAFEKAGILAPGLKIRDGLATINGSNVLTAMSAIHLYDMLRWLKQAEIGCAMSLEALLANLKPYDERIHKIRGFSGSIKSAANIRNCVEGSDLLVPGKLKLKVQDAYSMRSTPQVIGAARDALDYARSQVEIELNGVGDNPIFLPDHGEVLSGANFQGSPVAVPMDMAGAAITMVCVLSERRLNRLLHWALSSGLPGFLTEKGGLMSGMMLSQYCADMQIVEARILSAPASIQSIPAAADQEDFVSMGMNTAIKNAQILDNANGVLGIEFMAAAQALDLRCKPKYCSDYIGEGNIFNPGKGTTRAREVVRKHVDFLDIDRPLYPDHTAMKELVRSGEILEEVEKVLGKLQG